MEWTAFIPHDSLFHSLWEKFYYTLSNIERDDQIFVEEKMIQYLEQHQVPLSSEGFFSSRWQSSLLQVCGGFSTYSSNAQESFFAKLDAFEPSGEQHRDVAAVFVGLRRFAMTEQKDRSYERVVSLPCGPNLLAPVLLRGDGLQIVRGGLHSSQFRRTTVDKMLAADCAGKVFFSELEENIHEDPGRLAWNKGWVFCKQGMEKFDQEEATKFVKILISESNVALKVALENADCMHEDQVSVSAVQKLFSKYVVVGVNAAGKVFDTSVEFVKQGISEHFLFIMIKIGKIPYLSLDAAPVAEAKAKAQTKAAKARAKAVEGFGTPKRTPRAERENLLAEALAEGPPRNPAAAVGLQGARRVPLELPFAPVRPQDDPVRWEVPRCAEPSAVVKLAERQVAYLGAAQVPRATRLVPATWHPPVGGGRTDFVSVASGSAADPERGQADAFFKCETCQKWWAVSETEAVGFERLSFECALKGGRCLSQRKRKASGSEL